MTHTRTLGLLTLLLGTSLLCACGGGGGGGVGGVDLLLESVTLTAPPELDGVVDVSGFITFNPASSFSYTGDLEGSYRPGYYGRQLYAFSMAPVPAGASIVRAELRLYQRTVEGDPYGKDGVVVVDHVDYVPAPGPDSYDGQSLARDIGILSADAVLEVKTLDVSDAVRATRTAGNIWAQFRLRFYTDIHLPILDHVNDYVRFTDAEVGSGDTRPRLVVWYRP